MDGWWLWDVDYVDTYNVFLVIRKFGDFAGVWVGGWLCCFEELDRVNGE